MIDNRFGIAEPLYPEVAERYMKQFLQLQIYDLLDTPTLNELDKCWYHYFAEFFFGSVDIDVRIRQIQEFFVLIPKKNAKSTIAGLLMLMVLVTNRIRGAEFAVISPSKEVTQNAFTPIVEAIRLNPALSKIIKVPVSASAEILTNVQTGATLKVIAALPKVVQGKKFQGVLIDEIGLWQDIKNSGSMLNEITGNLVNKKDSFVIYLTTQTSEPPKGIFKTLLTRARNVKQEATAAKKQGKSEVDVYINHSLYPLLYEYSADDIKKRVFEKPSTWSKVNPNLGISVSLDRLKTMYDAAKNSDISMLNEFYAKYLNVEIQPADTLDCWHGTDFWLKAHKHQSLRTMVKEAQYCYIGIDGGGLDDLNGLSALFINNSDSDNVTYTSYSYATCYKSALARQGLANKLQEFVKTDDCYIADKLGDDDAALVDRISTILDLCAEYNVKVCGIGIDPHASGDIPDLLNTVLKVHNINDSLITYVTQAQNLMHAEQFLLRKLSSKSFRPQKTDLMTFVVNNVQVEDRQDGYFLSKKSSQFKIDPLIALLNAIWLFLNNPDATNKIDNNIERIKELFDNVTV